MEPSIGNVCHSMPSVKRHIKHREHIQMTRHYKHYNFYRNPRFSDIQVKNYIVSIINWILIRLYYHLSVTYNLTFICYVKCSYYNNGSYWRQNKLPKVFSILKFPTFVLHPQTYLSLYTCSYEPGGQVMHTRDVYATPKVWHMCTYFNNLCSATTMSHSRIK